MLVQLCRSKFGTSEDVEIALRRLIVLAKDVLGVEWAPVNEGELESTWNLCFVFVKLGGSSPSQGKKVMGSNIA